jgi:hypothetical protein
MQPKDHSDLDNSLTYSATLQKLVKDFMLEDMRVAGDTVEMLVNCCTGMKNSSQHPESNATWIP